MRPISGKGTVSKELVMQALTTIRGLTISNSHYAFVQIFEKKILTNPSSTNPTQEVKYIPLRKLMAAFYLLSKDSRSSKV